MIETVGKVKQIIAETLLKEEDEIIESAHIIDDLGADSMIHVEIILALEEAFDITIEDKQAESILTVKDAIDKITELTE